MTALEDAVARACEMHAEGVSAVPGEIEALCRRVSVVRRHRRQGRVAAAAASMSLMVTGGWFVSTRNPAADTRLHPTTGQSATIVPWRAQPYSPNSRVATGYTLPTHGGYPTSCALGDLTVVPVTGVTNGTTYLSLHIRNTGRSACRVDGEPGLALYSVSGQLIARSVAAPTPGGVVLAPGSWARTDSLAVSDGSCDSPPPVRLRLTLPGAGGATTVAVPRQGGQPSCPPESAGAVAPIAAGSFLAIARTDSAAEFPGLDQVHVSVKAPRSARAGATFDYVVALTNAGTLPLTFDPTTCPAFRESLGVESATYLLSCASVSRLAPGGTVRFAMRMPVPDSATGMRSLMWSMIEPAGPAATSRVNVTR